LENTTTVTSHSVGSVTSARRPRYRRSSANRCS
jgi:hypothetical protein